MPGFDLRAALGIVRGAPADAIAALDQADMLAAAEADKAAKRAADRLAKLEAAIPARVEAIVADFATIEAEAIRVAATKLARSQLAAELAITDPQTLAVSGWPTRLAASAVDKARTALAGSTPLPWAAKDRGAAAFKSAKSIEIHAGIEAAQATPVDDVEQRIADRRAKLEAERQAAIVARKRAAGIAS